MTSKNKTSTAKLIQENKTYSDKVESLQNLLDRATLLNDTLQANLAAHLTAHSDLQTKFLESHTANKQLTEQVSAKDALLEDTNTAHLENTAHHQREARLKIINLEKNFEQQLQDALVNIRASNTQHVETIIQKNKQIHDLEEKNHNLKEENQNLDTHNHALLHSTSWKITQPVRSLVTFLKLR